MFLQSKNHNDIELKYLTSGPYYLIYVCVCHIHDIIWYICVWHLYLHVMIYTSLQICFISFINHTYIWLKIHLFNISYIYIYTYIFYPAFNIYACVYVCTYVHPPSKYIYFLIYFYIIGAFYTLTYYLLNSVFLYHTRSLEWYFW